MKMIFEGWVLSRAWTKLLNATCTMKCNFWPLSPKLTTLPKCQKWHFFASITQFIQFNGDVTNNAVLFCCYDVLDLKMTHFKILMFYTSCTYFLYLLVILKHQTSLELQNCPMWLRCFWSPPNTTMRSSWTVAEWPAIDGGLAVPSGVKWDHRFCTMS